MIDASSFSNLTERLASRLDSRENSRHSKKIHALLSRLLGLQCPKLCQQGIQHGDWVALVEAALMSAFTTFRPFVRGRFQPQIWPVCAVGTGAQLGVAQLRFAVSCSRMARHEE